MTFRTRLLITFLLAVLLPMIALALFIRHEMTGRLTAQYERRVEALLTVIEEDLAEESRGIAASLAILRQAAVDDNRFRRAAVDRDPEERRYLLDYAANAMHLTGLSMLQIQDDHGRIISSGHFRNEYDRIERALPDLLSATPKGTALTQARTPDAFFLALVRLDSLRIGGKRFTMVGGIAVERRFLAGLARGAGLSVELVYPGGIIPSGASGSSHAPVDAIERELTVPFIDSGLKERAVATFRVTHWLTELHSLRRSIDRWFLIAVAATSVLTIFLVSWLASRISRPLVELADKTSRIDLDRLDIEFDTHRRDEIGSLSRILRAMTERLRTSAALVKDAERRATRGELARQVNHDIKNGLTPIRNVFRHLIQLASDDPKQLPDVIEERKNTLDDSITYLENLATNYARLSPPSEPRPCDVNEIIRRLMTNSRANGEAQIVLDLADRAVVLADPVSLRRVLENLIDNAVDSLESRPGKVSISSALKPGESEQVRIAVADTGVGMTEEQLANVFNDFYTTKQGGTGLGLSIVRRLVMDMGGSVHVESEHGQGSCFFIDLPEVGGQRSDIESGG